MPRTSPSPSTAVTEVVDALAPLVAHHRRTWARRCHAHGLSLTGFEVLALLEMHGPMSMTQLAGELGVALPNATGIVSRLAERGIVERIGDESDRRVVRVDLTAAGRQLVADIEAERRQRTQRLIALLDPEQQRRLLELIRALRDAAARLAEEEDALTNATGAQDKETRT